MKFLCKYNNVSTNDELFSLITSTFKTSNTQWSYFVNWEKVLSNVEPIEKELNILNYLIGKKNLKREIVLLITEYPSVVKAFPILLASRKKSFEILIDTKNFIYKNFNFNQKPISETEISDLADFLIKSGIAKLLQNENIKNVVDYVTGVEVGLDSNGRKNRGGQLMETIVETFVDETTKNLKLNFMCQASAIKIKEQWNIDVEVDKSRRVIDFAINKAGKLYFIETNFYGGGGSKLKSTATEYIQMNEYWNKQGIVFIWITDGAGWKSTLKPLREYFDKADYLLNLEMLQKGFLTEIVKGE